MIFCKHQAKAAWKSQIGKIVAIEQVECSIAIGCTMIDPRIPAAGKLIVKKVEEERKTASGLFLVDTKESPRLQKTIIIAVNDKNPEGFVAGYFAYISAGIGYELDNDELLVFEKDVLYCMLGSE